MRTSTSPKRRFFLFVFALSLLAACDDPSERAVRHYDRGLSLLESSAPEKAALEFRNALRLDDGFVAARFELAKLLEQADDLTGALANLRVVVEHDPAHAQARVKLANAMLLSDRAEAAMKHAEIAVRAAPQLPSAWVARSMAAFRLDDVQIALQDAERALSLDPSNPDAGLLLVIERHAAGDLAAAHSILDRFIAANPSSLTLHLTKLQYLLAGTDQTAASEQLDRMVEVFPANVELRRSKADWHLGRAEFQEAGVELRALKELRPNDIEVLGALVSLRAKERGIPAARQILLDEIARSGAPDQVRLLLAKFDHQSGAHDAAKSTLLSLISETEDSETAANARIALSRIMGSEHNFAGVIEHTSLLLERDPGNAKALSLRAAAYLQDNTLDKALFDSRRPRDETCDLLTCMRQRFIVPADQIHTVERYKLCHPLHQCCVVR